MTDRRNSRDGRTRRGTIAFAAAASAFAIVIPQASAADIVPTEPSTIFTIEPLNNNRYVATPNSMGGVMCMAPHSCVMVPTAASLDPSHKDGVFGEEGSIADGAATLDAMLNEAQGPVVVMGRSQGAQIGGFWLRNYVPDSSVDRERVSFLFLADPENSYGVPWAPRVPTNTGYQVTELWVQYDGWAEWPTRWYPIAVANAVMGMFTVHTQAYYDIDPYDPDIIEWSANGIDYKMVPNSRLPLLTPLRKLGMGWLADMLNDPLAARVEAAYDRPNSQEEADALFPAEQETVAQARTVPVDPDREVAEDDGTTSNVQAVEPAGGEASGNGTATDMPKPKPEPESDAEPESEPEAGTESESEAGTGLAGEDNGSADEQDSRSERKLGRDDDTAGERGSALNPAPRNEPESDGSDGSDDSGSDSSES